jgi:Holliday junction resolvase
MVNPSKAKGTKFETDVLNYLRANRLKAERLALSGTEDEGDIAVQFGSGYEILECKAEQRFSIPAYLREAERERINFAAHRKIDLKNVEGVVVLKLRQAPIGKCAVITTVDNFWDIT